MLAQHRCAVLHKRIIEGLFAVFDQSVQIRLANTGQILGLHSVITDVSETVELGEDQVTAKLSDAVVVHN